MRFLKGLGLTTAAVLTLFVLWVAPVTAQDVPRLQTEVTDLTQARVLSSGAARIGPALTDLQQSAGVRLLALFVDTTSGRSITGFADAVAAQNSLGPTDVLLVVAIADRTDAFWRGSAAAERLTDRQLNDILDRRVEPSLVQGDFGGAVVAAAQGIRETSGAGSSGAANEGAGPNLTPLLILAALGVAAWYVWRTLAGRRERQQTAAREEGELAQLSDQANTLLIAADEALRSSQQEVSFAEAQFNEEDVAPYRQAVAASAEELKAAFALRQQLDDAEPEDPPTRRKLLEGIQQHAGRAEQLLAEQRQRLEALRDLERNAPQILAQLPAKIAELEAKLPRAQATLASLEGYSPQALAGVKGNIAEAEKRIAHARGAVQAADSALGSSDAASTAGKTTVALPVAPTAVQNIRAAQQALAEAEQLLAAIATLADSIRQAEQNAGPQLAQARVDLDSARQAISSVGESPFMTELRQAEAQLGQAQALLADERPDYLTALRLAAQAEATADQIVASIHQEVERHLEAQRILAAQLQVAEAAFQQAADFIQARRAGIGRAARTRLVESQRHLERAHALANGDAHAALAEAQRAEQLAAEAYQLAQDDFDDYDRNGTDFFGGSRRSGGGIFPIPVPVGGGWGGGGWGGSSWGSGGSIGGGWGGGGGSTGGSWGGGGSSTGGSW